MTLTVRDFVNLVNIEVIQDLGHQSDQPRGLLWIPMQGGHPSEAED